jgi:hypothetical protein
MFPSRVAGSGGPAARDLRVATPMETILLNVMESWPLQLAIQAAGGPEIVALAEHVRIRRAGVLIDPGKLQAGQRIRIVSKNSRGEIVDLEVI